MELVLIEWNPFSHMELVFHESDRGHGEPGAPATRGPASSAAPS